jgi:ribosome biogenesis GTPase
MRELQLSGTGDGLDTLFEDIQSRAAECRFSDCAHDSEPGCAVTAAIKSGQLDPDRLTRWRKLEREDRRGALARQILREDRQRRTAARTAKAPYRRLNQHGRAAGSAHCRVVQWLCAICRSVKLWRSRR